MVSCSVSAFAQPADTQPKKQKPDPRVNGWLKQMDKDEDGKLTEDESLGLMKRFFKQNDKNNDGFLDRAELNAVSALVARNQGRNRNQKTVSDEQVLKSVPDGVTVELNVPYRDGNEAWKLDLAMPEESTGELRPAIVFIHGGGFVGGDKRNGIFLTQPLEFASNGYVCVTINYRLTREIAPCVEDVKCAVRWLRAHAEKYQIDPNHIGAFGNSAGAHLVSMLGLSADEESLNGDAPWQEHSSAVQAVAAAATPAHLRFKDPTDDKAKHLEPMTYVSADAPPFLLFHDEADKTVPVSHSDDFAKALKEAGAKDVTYKRYTNNSGHGVFNRNSKETYPEMERFFARTLRGSKAKPTE